MSDSSITNGLPTKALIAFYDEYGHLICQITCERPDMQHTIQAVQKQMWDLSRRNVARWEILKEF